MIAIILESFYSFKFNSNHELGTQLIMYACVHVVKIGKESISSYVRKNIDSCKITNGVPVVNMKVEVISIMRESDSAGCYKYLKCNIQKLATDRIKRNTGLAKPWSLLSSKDICDTNIKTIYMKSKETYNCKSESLSNLNKMLKVKYRELIRLKTQTSSIISKDYINYNLKSKKIAMVDSQDILDGDMIEAERELSMLYEEYLVGEMPYSIAKM
jgi:hypothetical protein